MLQTHSFSNYSGGLLGYCHKVVAYKVDSIKKSCHPTMNFTVELEAMTRLWSDLAPHFLEYSQKRILCELEEHSQLLNDSVETCDMGLFY